MAAAKRTGKSAATPPGQETRPRRLGRGPADATVRQPDQIVKVKDPLPGENELLGYDPDRGHPITEQEALGVLRRRKRAEWTKRGMPAREIEKNLPTSIASWDDAKEAVTLRIQPRLYALASAHAEAEGIGFAALFEEALTTRVLQPPRDPAEVRKAIEKLEAATVRLDRLEKRLDASPSEDNPHEELAKIRAELANLRAALGT